MTKIQSKALTENMAVTKVVEISLDEDAAWLLESTKSHFGIHGRCKEFLEEVYHPFVNPEIALNLLRVGVLGDIWFYMENPERNKTLKVLFGCYLSLVDKLIDRSQEIRFISDILDLLSALGDQENLEEEHLLWLLEQLSGWKERFGAHFLKMGGSFLKTIGSLKNYPKLVASAFELLRDIFSESLSFWEKECALFPVESVPLDEDGFPQTQYFKALQERLAKVSDFSELAAIPSYSNIADRLREALCRVENVEDRIQYIFYLLGLTGMEDLRDHLLWDLNRELSRIYSGLNLQSIPGVIDSVFGFLSGFKDSHRSIVLDCLLTSGRNVVKSGNKEHISHFIRKLSAMEFTPPGKVTVRDDWQLETDKNHIKHLRLCLELIALNPLLCKDLLAYLIISVSRVGVFISDEDLFQKDVSNLLNAQIAPVYIQLKHLLRQFPVFFNEIGAEGEIREVSTEIDEMSQREDRLIHFLRKQVHTESNNTHIQLSVSILNYWESLDPSPLQDIVPADVMLYLESEAPLLLAQQQAVKDFLTAQKLDLVGLIDYSWQRLEKLFEGTKDNWHLHRLHLLCNIHLLMKDKYGLDPYDIVKFLSRYRFFDAKEQNRLRTSLIRRDYDSSVRQLLGYIGKLNLIILNPKASSSWENIYYKRHIAAGIPSMYGTYREAKLEAMGMVFRIENLVRRLFGYNVQQINLSYINHKNMRRTIRVLELYDFAMRQEVLTSAAFSSAVSMLDSAQSISNCRLEQYIDIFRLLKDSLNEIISEYYYRFYDPALKRTAHGSADRHALEVFAEEFYRKLLSASFMVQGLDVFITRILESLAEMGKLFRPDDVLKLMSYDPDKLFFPLHSSNSHHGNQLLLGSKGYYLNRLWHYEFPVPHGFVITTELYRNREMVNTHPDISNEFDELLKQNLCKLQKDTRLVYGDPLKPLLLSVRSGAPMSLPGAMDTFLNIGLNDEICLKLSQQPNYGWTAWDSYRRLIQSWGMSYGIKRDLFDRVMIDYKQRYNINLKTQFPPELMQQMTEDYKAVLSSHDVHFEQDAYLQLYKAISHVLDSWNTDRAKLYRQHLQISNEWGTAVIVQKMVMGNISLESGSGVLFTHADWHSEPGICLNGDFTICSQGEDVVAGLVHTLPISELQAQASSATAGTSLEVLFPAIYNRLYRIANQLITDKNFPHQEIEFTFEGPAEEQLFILQTRNQVIQKVPDYQVLCDNTNIPEIGSGIGIGKGSLSGIIVIRAEDIKRFSSKEEALILVRPDTVPDDMELLFQCQGLLTSRGGVTSHAAVTATRLGLIGIVNCWDLTVDESSSSCKLGDIELKAGDFITLDATTGSIYNGKHAMKSIHEMV